MEGNSTIEEIYLADSEINRFCFFIQRNLSSRFSPNTDSFLRYEKISILEEIGDSIRDYHRFYKKKNEEKDFLKEISKIIEKFRLANSEKEFDLFNKIKLDLKEIKSKIGEPSKLKSPSKVSARGLFDNLYSLHDNLLATKIKNSSHLLG